MTRCGIVQNSPPGTGGDDERQRVGVVDQTHIEESFRELDLPPRPHFVRAPLLFQEGSFASQSVKYIASDSVGQFHIAQFQIDPLP